MSDLQEKQQQYSSLRKQKAELDLSLQKKQAALSDLTLTEKQELKGLDQESLAEKKAEYSRKKQDLTAQVEAISTQRKSLYQDIERLSAGFLDQLNPVDRVQEISDEFPILMFPLRLETRFKSTGDQQQLWLRVYPDDCNINAKEELLSESELESTRDFWIETWKAGGIEAEERGAWRSLVDGHGTGRSIWMIEQFKPENAKPEKPDADHKILVVTSSFEDLEENEQKEARKYWAAVWLADGNKEALNEAFANLQTAVGSAKANEIKENFIPVNLSDEVPDGINEEQVLLESLVLPPEDDVITTQASWNQVPKAIALPDRFVAVLYKGENKKVVVFDKHVQENLAVGPDPSLSPDEQIKKDEHGDILINEDLKWMVEFDKAVTAGMGVKIDLNAQEAADGFDKLFVTGLRFSSNPTDNKSLLEKLLTDHFHSSNGFGLLKQGTPTNNTEDEPAGYTWIDDPDESFDRVFKSMEEFEEKDELAEKSDGQKLAESLGIDPGILKKVSNANGRDQLEANAMNRALFPATLGYFMEEMMNPLFRDHDIDATKVFFSHFVSGRGPLPAIKIGKQPYGILPVSVYSKLRFYERNPHAILNSLGTYKDQYLVRLHNFISKMDEEWDKMLPQVPFIGKDGDPHQTLLDVIGLHAGSVEFHQRYAQSFQQLYNQLQLQQLDISSALQAIFSVIRAKILLDDFGINPNNIDLPILEKYFLSEPNKLSGPFIDDVPYSETDPVRPYTSDETQNYIEWLSSSDVETVRTQNFGGSPAPNAMLYLLLRHALMQSQSNAATQLLVNHNIIADKKQFFDPDFIHVQQEGGGNSKFDHLYSTNQAITGNNDVKLKDHIYQSNVLWESLETRRLRENIDALKVLEKTPTARLERLLAEHLDCCNYRIDAWKTGLVSYKLTEQRLLNRQDGKPSQGIHLGAYGWLLEVKPEEKSLTEVTLPEELNEIFNRGNATTIKEDNSNLGYIHAPSLNQAATAAILRNTYDSNKDSGSENQFAINLTSDRVRIAKSFLEGMRNGQSLAALLGYQFERALHDAKAETNKFIYPLRKVFPLVADNLEDTKSETTDSIESIEANNVIDGLKLINHIKETSREYPFDISPDYNLPAANNDEAEVINKEVLRLIDTHDAISDLVVSEEIYQVVQGNFERAAGNAEAFSKGNYPPDIDVMNTPRSGVTLTQRMAIQFDTEADPDTSPNAMVMTPRAKAEPAVNKWLAVILPDPEKVLCKVTYSSPDEPDEKSVDVSQEDLELQPIDLLYCFDLDTDQAMTELDDRISHYIRYTVSRHPATKIEIHYTEQIDEADRSKISFFELAGLIKNLRKICLGNDFLKPQSVTLHDTVDDPYALIDDEQFSDRITDGKTELNTIKDNIGTMLSGTTSVAGLIDAFITDHENDVSDDQKLEALTDQMKKDLKDYLADPTPENKTDILTAFEDSLGFITDAAVIDTLKNEFETALDNYLTDFSNFDELVEDSINLFKNVALYSNSQTGTGFMFDGIGGMYESLFVKLDKVIERWEQKIIDFEDIMLGYDPAGIEEDQYDLLRKAERKISTELTLPTPATLADYKNIIDGKKSSMDDILTHLKSLKTTDEEKVIDFLTGAEPHIRNIRDHDLIDFDTENERSDLASEKRLLASLKEEIILALRNLNEILTDKTAAAQEEIKLAGETEVPGEKITHLQNAAKLVFGEDALLLPHFSVSEAQGNEIEHSYANSEGLLKFIKEEIKEEDRKELPVDEWLSGVSRVREKIHHWENASFLANAFSPDQSLDITPLQFPYRDEDRWAALKFRDEDKNEEADEDDEKEKDDFRIDEDKLLYTAHYAVPFDKTKPQCGIVIDEWTEVIPSEEETTGIAFHYDQPNSEPPQTMLLVTPPEFTGNWKWDDIIESMEETLEMAKKRTIEPAIVEKSSYAQFLPTTMMAVTLHWITIATNLAMNNNIYQKIEEE